MKKTLVALINFIAVITLITVISPSAFAQYGQYGQYGQPTSIESILIDKQVGKPAGTTKGGITNYDYIDNLSPSDLRFAPGAIVMYKLRVKNTSTIVIYNVMVEDKVPSYIEPVEGPGAYDSAARTISFNAGTFQPNEEKTYYLKMQWLAQNLLPADKGLICVTNYARAYTNNASDDDTAQACVEKQVVGVKSAPKAGPEMNILMVAAELATLGIGISLKKKTSKITK